MSGSSIQENSRVFRLSQMGEYTANINSILNAYTKGSAVGTGSAHIILREDMSRKVGESIAYTSASMYDMTLPYENTGADHALHNEVQRIRKDMNICRSTHKRLLRGAIETMYRKGLKVAKLSSKLEQSTTAYK